MFGFLGKRSGAPAAEASTAQPSAPAENGAGMGMYSSQAAAALAAAPDNISAPAVVRIGRVLRDPVIEYNAGVLLDGESQPELRVRRRVPMDVFWAPCMHVLACI